MNIDGIRILSQEAIMESPDFVWTIAGLLVVLFLIFAVILGIFKYDDWAFITFAICGAITFLWIIFIMIGGVFERPSDRYTYKCFFEKDISIQKIYDNYDIIGRDGDIWILKDKEE